MSKFRQLIFYIYFKKIFLNVNFRLLFYKLSDIKENFPVPGEYYFRFKFEFNGKKVWIDFNNPNGALPQFDGKVIMKVTRLNFNEQKQPQQNNNIFPEI